MEDTEPTHPISMPPPSPALAAALKEELARPGYAEMDEDEASMLALEKAYEQHGVDLFDIANATDTIIHEMLILQLADQ